MTPHEFPRSTRGSFFELLLGLRNEDSCAPTESLFRSTPVVRLMPKTGEIADRSGVYRFAGHLGGGMGCHPTAEEKEIPLAKGERFPPIRSCQKGAQWEFVRDA
jgi:hypothetical protein